MLLYDVLYSRLLFIWINAIPCTLSFSEPMRQPWVCQIICTLWMKKVCALNFITHVNFKVLLKSVGGNIPLFEHFHRAERNESEINPGLFIKCVSYSFPWKEERLTKQNFGDSITPIYWDLFSLLGILVSIQLTQFPYLPLI